jgi:hypothetical protein
VSEDGLTALLVKDGGILVDNTGTEIYSQLLGDAGFLGFQMDSARELLVYKEADCSGNAHYSIGSGHSKLFQSPVTSWGGEAGTPPIFLEKESTSTPSEFVSFKVNGDVWSDNPSQLQTRYGITLSQVGSCLSANAKVRAMIQEVKFAEVTEWVPPNMGNWRIENR